MSEHTSAFWWSCRFCLEERLRLAEEEAYEMQERKKEAERVADFARGQLRELEKSR